MKKCSVKKLYPSRVTNKKNIAFLQQHLDSLNFDRQINIKKSGNLFSLFFLCLFFPFPHIFNHTFDFEIKNNSIERHFEIFTSNY